MVSPTWGKSLLVMALITTAGACQEPSTPWQLLSRANSSASPAAAEACTPAANAQRWSNVVISEQWAGTRRTAASCSRALQAWAQQSMQEVLPGTPAVWLTRLLLQQQRLVV